MAHGSMAAGRSRLSRCVGLPMSCCGRSLVRDGEPLGPTGMAEQFQIRIVELEASLASAAPGQRRAINKRLRMAKDMLKWCKSRAGYTRSS